VFWQLITAAGSPYALVGALALTAVLILLAGRVLGAPRELSPVRRLAVALRRRAAGTAFLRLRDPDGAGRPRPRAPSLAVHLS
jgi:hypothetical protein